MSRFDYVKYDDVYAEIQSEFKVLVTALEQHIDDAIESPRAKALALTRLEEVYMWIGKGIRDDQLSQLRKVDLQEERTNS